MRGRLSRSTIELLYTGGTVLLATVAGIIVFSTIGPPPAIFPMNPLIFAGLATAVTILAALPQDDASFHEPRRMRRLLLCLGGGAEEVLWRGAGISSLAYLGLPMPWAHIIITVGFTAIHLERYGRRGLGFIAIFSLFMAVTTWLLGLLIAVFFHVSWNAFMCLRRHTYRPSPGTRLVQRRPTDEW